MDVQKELEKAKEEIEKAKETANSTLVPTTAVEEKSSAMKLVDTQEQAVLKTDDAIKAAGKIGYERVHADFKSEAAKINEKNIATAEKEFDNETRKRRLERLNAEMDLQHKYNMSMIKANGEHNQMLDKRKKMVEKYGYLYDTKECTKGYDGEGKEYDVPKDFSYSEMVNKFRQFGRNVSKLDKPVLQTIKWFLILGGLVAAFFVLRALGIIG